MLASFSPARRLLEALNRLQIPQAFFAIVVGTSTATLSKYLNGLWTSGEADIKWLQQIKLIEELIRVSLPLHLNFHPRHGESFKKILRDFEKRQLLISVVDLGPQRQVSEDIRKAAEFLADALYPLEGRI